MSERTPFVIYVFALCAFALGFTEFVTIGLVSNISEDLHTSVSQVGTAVTAYALGAVIGAPGLTALATRWPRKRLLLVAMALFTLGNAIVSLSDSLTPMLVARFASGLGHGVFLAVASSVATQLVGRDRAGLAVAVVFGGLTLALALGVPLGTYLGSLFNWPVIFMAVAVSGAMGFLGLLLLMPTDHNDASNQANALDGLKAMFNPRLLAGAGITVLAYAGSFALYTYISPILLHVTKVHESTGSLLMLGYGVMAAIGNVWGGRLTDRKGADYAVMIILVGLAVVLLAIGASAVSVALMAILIGLLGALTYAAVPALQTRVIGLSHEHAPQAPAVAAGLNIAGFNGGIALGSILGGIALEITGLASTAWVGACVVVLGIVWMLFQMLGAKSKRAFVR
ncbi:major facilitator superfamily MFS_1 [Serratia sp. AS12]|uniref:MFS transporter n=1 Tax=Serratia TaxID=613 RepID=UPI00020E98F3|nr:MULTISPECIES: MFS transporter [Serratia]AEF46436.1 major facilitator superfamily MFS_1 [Serratia plymuthica AS9]AEF51388.1 major facilitator superfamily MFS_1 [Serratia sp. AS12]AEG29096.1 major facilitator superfamily MFS_1 [Serratia sp. AS13]UTN95150.1 MFS transporter [Serratia plymuthica]